MAYRDLRDFIAQLEAQGELKRVRVEVDPRLEMTELCDRVLKTGGPALLFERPKGSFPAPGGGTIAVLGNLFGTPQRVARAMGADPANWADSLREVGRLLAFLKEPEPPKSLRDAWQTTRPVFMKVLDMAPKERSGAPCQEVVWEGADVDLGRLPVQTCWPGDAGPLITWGLTVTRGPLKKRQNLGIYRQQVIARDKVIMRWLAHRGGALDCRDHARVHPGTPFPVAVALGADPATILGAVTPVPDSLSEYQFAGLLRGGRTEIVRCLTHDLQVPASAEIVLEGFIRPDASDPTGYETAAEGPFGDHTGYYNEVERFRCSPSTGSRCDATRSYHSTYTGKPPDEPAILGVALNEVFVPLLQKQYPEIADFYLPPEGCSYRLGRGVAEEAVPRPREARDVRRVELPAPVHVHEDHRRHRRRRGRPRLEGGGLGAHHARRPGSRHAPRPVDADRLPRLRLAGVGARQQDGDRRDQQVARRNHARMGTPHPHGRRRQGKGGRAHARPRALIRVIAVPRDCRTLA